MLMNVHVMYNVDVHVHGYVHVCVHVDAHSTRALTGVGQQHLDLGDGDAVAVVETCVDLGARERLQRAAVRLRLTLHLQLAYKTHQNTHSRDVINDRQAHFNT